MLIGGINTLTLLDYPGKTACILFTVGCNFRCGFCHNSQFVLPEEIKSYQASHLIPEEKFFNFLKSRVGLLDGVVVSGGEPTLQSDLILFLEKVKKLGFLVKLDTNGTNFQVLEKCLEKNLLDYIAMDVKASSEKYNELAGVVVDVSEIEKSRDLLMGSGIDYEFRTTVISEFHDDNEMERIGGFCKNAKRFTIQNFRNEKVLDPKFQGFSGFEKEYLRRFQKIVKKYEIEDVVVQNGN